MNHYIILAVLAAAACSGGDTGDVAPPIVATDAATRTPLAGVDVVDSILPMPVMIERFQARAGAAVVGLGPNSATSRDSLVLRFVRAVEGSSRGELQALRLSSQEYAYLYVPTSRLTAEPYRQPPELGWMLVEQNGLKGEVRVLRHFGGRTLGFRGYRCSDPIREGENTLWEHCVVEIAARAEPIRLFGSIIERAGRFRFVSLANDL